MTMEKELKYLLSESEFIALGNKLREYGGGEEILKLRTWYWDTDSNFLRTQHTVIRIRDDGDKAVLSMKAGIIGRLPGENHEHLQVAKELSFDVTSGFRKNKELLIENMGAGNIHTGLLENREAEAFLLELYKDLGITGTDVHAFGLITVIRRRGHFFPYNMPYELDACNYGKAELSTFESQREDWELEIEDENPEKWLNVVSMLFRTLNIEKRSMKKKVERLYEALGM